MVSSKIATKVKTATNQDEDIPYIGQTPDSSFKTVYKDGGLKMNCKYLYMTVEQFLARQDSKLALWFYMGRNNNAGRYREWFVAPYDMTSNLRFIVYELR